MEKPVPMYNVITMLWIGMFSATLLVQSHDLVGIPTQMLVQVHVWSVSQPKC